MKTTFAIWTAAAATIFAAGLAWTGTAGADDIKIGYINKMGDHPWFVAEVGGAKKTAEEGGATFVSQDVQFDANLTITTFDTMVGDGVKGIAIVVPDKALGPVIAHLVDVADLDVVGAGHAGPCEAGGKRRRGRCRPDCICGRLHEVLPEPFVDRQSW